MNDTIITVVTIFVILIVMLTVLILFIIVVIVVKTRRKTDSQLHYEEIDMHAIPADNVPHHHTNSDAEVNVYEIICDNSSNCASVQSSRVHNRHDEDNVRNPRPDNVFSGMEMYEIISRYERVPHADINLILRQAACEDGNMISSSNGCDFDCHNHYERAQVYERITGYEQVPMVDIAQILSCHAHSAAPQHIVTPTTPCSVVPYEQIPLYEQSHNSERTEVLIESLRARRECPESDGLPHLYERVQYSESVQQMISRLQRRTDQLPHLYERVQYSESVQQMISRLQRRTDQLPHLYERVQYSESVQQMISGLSDKNFKPFPNNELYPLYERVKYSEIVQQIISILQRSNQSFEIIPEDRKFESAEQYISEVMVYEGQYATYV